MERAQSVGAMDSRSSSDGEGNLENDSTPERNEIEEIKKSSSSATRKVRSFRFLIACLLAAMIVVIGVTYIILVREQQQSFREAFSQFSGAVHDALIVNQRHLHKAATSLSNFVSLQSELMEVEWPFYNHPNHDIFFKDEIDAGLQFIEGIGVIIMVTRQERQSMIDFETAYCEERATKGHMSHFGNLDLFGPGAPADMLAITAEGLVLSPEKDFYMTITYRYPPMDSCQALVDVASDPEYGPLIGTVMELDMTLISTVRGYVEFSEGSEKIHKKMHSELPGDSESKVTFPHSYMFTPVRQRLNDTDSPVVAVIFVNIAYDLALRNLLPDDAHGIIVVGRNSCNQSFTYLINGKEAYFVGYGDKHSTDFDDMEVFVDLGVGMNPGYFDAPNHCYYTMHVYPSDVFRNKYITNSPLIFVVSVASTFFLIICAFLVYDWSVQRRNHNLVRTAAKSSEIVSSMFPGAMRDMVMNERNAEYQFDSAGYDGIPLAEEYPDTTLLFADIKGFTAWSSERAPVAVFALLEAIFGAFDDVAKKDRVFKVETVGDCYVAVTGVPYAQADHALRMCRFAKACISMFATITRQLDDRLGAGTADLGLRVGIHSGSVTGGVLRGLRSRFQLFGDAMNTASRMETNSQAGRIHLSQETAELVKKAGKEHWLQKREDTVFAKGKGQLQTFWLRLGGGSTEASGTDGDGLNALVAEEKVAEMTEKLKACIPEPQPEGSTAELHDAPGLEIFWTRSHRTGS